MNSKVLNKRQERAIAAASMGDKRIYQERIFNNSASWWAFTRHGSVRLKLTCRDVSGLSNLGLVVFEQIGKCYALVDQKKTLQITVMAQVD